MKNLNADTVLWLVGHGACLALILFRRLWDNSPELVSASFRDLSDDADNASAASSVRPRFVWGDWELQDNDQLVLHFRVEGALIWWLTIDGECARLRHPTVMPKNFHAGQEGRIVMSFPGALDEPDDCPIEFGVRYCTTDGHIETQSFAWLIWREPSPVARELVLVA